MRALASYCAERENHIRRDEDTFLSLLLLLAFNCLESPFSGPRVVPSHALRTRAPRHFRKVRRRGFKVHLA